MQRTPPAADAHPAANPLLGTLLAVVGGATLPAQSRMNGALAVATGDAIFAALVSFGSGMVLLLLGLLAAPGRAALAREIAAIRSGALGWWIIVPGVLGAWLIVTQSVSVGVFGVALFTIILIAGQTGSGMLVDSIGFLAPRRPLGPARILAGVVTVGAVAWSVSGSIPESIGLGATLLVALMPLSAGLFSGFQQAINGRITTVTGSAHAATLTNFVLGTAALAVTVAIERFTLGLPLVPVLPDVWWMYLGGLMGIIFVFLGAMLVPRIGVLRITIALVAGQLIGSLLLDWLVPADGVGVSVVKVAAAALTLGAVALSALPDWMRRARR